jgi:hypothetical protein
MIEIGSNTGGFHAGSVDVLVSGASLGTIVVVAGIDSLDRFGGSTPGNAISGVTDSQGNVYTEDAAFGAQIPYPVSGGTGWVYGIIKAYTASGTLNPGDTVTVAGVNDVGVGPPPCAVVFDSSGLGGAATSATQVWPDTGVSGGFRLISDADALALSFSAAQSGYGGLAVIWPNASLAAWIESTHTTFIAGSLSPTPGWGFVQEDYLFVAYMSAVAVGVLHLPVQFRSFQEDEGQDTGT